MISIRTKWIALLLVILIYNPVYAELERSRITKIISLTQTHNKDSSLQEQSELFIQNLREKLPHFSEDQLETLKNAYEDAILEGEIAPSITEIENIKEVKIDNIQKEQLPKENKFSQRIRNHLKGNSTGVSSTNKEISTLTEEAKRTIILLTVERGDTLGDIAKRNYHDASMYIAIYEENKDQLKSPNSVPEGIILKVPVIDSTNKEKFHKMVIEYERTHKK